MNACKSMVFWTTILSLSLVMSLSIADSPKQADLKKPLQAEPASSFADLSGIYECEGRDIGPGNKGYSGVVTVHKQGQVYVIAWLVNGSSYGGIGISKVDGQRATLSASWVMSAGDGKLIKGVTVFDVRRANDSKGFVADGRWATIPGDGRQHAERLTWIKDLPVTPEEDGEK